MIVQTIQLTLADFNGGNPLSNSTIISLTKTQLQENPVAIVKTFKRVVIKLVIYYITNFLVVLIAI